MNSVAESAATRMKEVMPPVEMLRIFDGEPQSVRAFGEKFMTQLEKRRRRGFDPVPTGLPTLDAWLDGGLPRGQTAILAGAPGTGKTSFGLGVACGLAEHRHPALFVSLEHLRETVVSRLVGMKKGLPWGKVLRGMHNQAAAEVISTLPPFLHITDGVRSVEDLEQCVEELRVWYREAPFVVVDHVQLLMDLEEHGQRRSAELVASGLLTIARTCGSPMLLLSAVGRESYAVSSRNSKRVLAMAKETGKFESDAAVVMGVIITDDADPRNQTGHIKIAKNRFGGALERLSVRFDGLLGRFQEVTDEEVVTARGRKSGPKDEEKLRADILKALPGQRRIDRVAEIVGVRKQVVTRIIKQAESEGVAWKDKEGRFVVRDRVPL